MKPMMSLVSSLLMNAGSSYSTHFHVLVFLAADLGLGFAEAEDNQTSTASSNPVPTAPLAASTSTAPVPAYNNNSFTSKSARAYSPIRFYDDTDADVHAFESYLDSTPGAGSSKTSNKRKLEEPPTALSNFRRARENRSGFPSPQKSVTNPWAKDSKLRK